MSSDTPNDGQTFFMPNGTPPGFPQKQRPQEMGDGMLNHGWQSWNGQPPHEQKGPGMHSLNIMSPGMNK